MPFANLRTGARLHYEELGHGEPLIAVHGFLGTARHDLGNVMDWLKRRYQVYGPTRRGYGQSIPAPRTYTPDFYQKDAADLIAFMDALELDTAHLLGYSDGGETALIAAGQHPERFQSVAVWGAVGYFGPVVKEAARQMDPPIWLTAETQALHTIEDYDQLVKDWVAAIEAIVDDGGDLSLHLAQNITCPLLVMLGRQDTLNPVIYAEKLVERVPQAHLVLFDCGHAIHDEAWPDFKRVVGDFLRHGHYVPQRDSGLLARLRRWLGG